MNATDVITPLRFEDLNPVGRAIILTVAALTAGVAAVAFLTSYGALYAFVRDTGLYSDRLSRLYPLLLDAAFIVAELVAILFGIIRGPKGWPWFTMMLTGSLTVFFNIQHAGHGWDRRLVAALPPIMMMLAFQVDVAVVRSVMRALGRTEQAFGGVASDAFNGYGAGTFPPHGAFGSSPELDQSLRSAPRLDGSGNGHSKSTRYLVEAHLAALSPEQLRDTTEGEVYSALREAGVSVSKAYVGRVLGEWRAVRPDKKPAR